VTGTLVVDANPILAALLGGRARDLFFDPNFLFLTTRHTLQEVERHLPTISNRSGVSTEELRLALALLPLEVVPQSKYKNSLPRARKLLADIDPTDAEILALALATNNHLWSNDGHFEKIAEPIKLVKTRELF